jgi:hypothetical protein
MFMLNGCNLLRKTTGGRKSMPEGESIVRKVINAQPDWRFAEIRMTGKAEADDNRIGFMGTVKMERGHQIFIILRSTIGIELAKVYANTDSLWVISKVLSIKEKFDWKQAGGKIGYPLDFYAIQGILLQSLFTSSGDQVNNLINDLVVKKDSENLHLVSNEKEESNSKSFNYLNDFLIGNEYLNIIGSKIRDIKGQWIADIKYLYNNNNVIKKIEMKGIDSEHNFSGEFNIAKRDIKDFIDINFDKF